MGGARPIPAATFFPAIPAARHFAARPPAEV